MLKKLLVLATVLSAAPAYSLDAAQGTKTALTQLPAAETEVKVPAPAPAVEATAKEAAALPRYWAVVNAKTRDQRTELLSLGLSIEEKNAGTVAGIVNGDDLEKIQQAGFQVINKTTLAELNAKLVRDFPTADATYHNAAETYADLKTYAEQLKGYASLYSIGKSSEGRDIWCLRLNSNAADDAASDKPGAFFVGEHHAREHLSVEIPLLYAKWLANNKDSSDVKKVLDSTDIYIIPMFNPDGAEYDVKTGSYKYWRKNTRQLDGGVGVDLNRNYDNLWGQGGSSHSPMSETYMGPSAFSEPETQAMRAFLGKHTNIKLIATYHTYSREIYYPYGGQDDDIADAKDLKACKTIAAKMAELTGYDYMKSSDAYIATGDFADWAYDAHKMLAFTVEMDPASAGGGGFYPGAKAIDKAAPGNIKAMFYLSQMAANPYAAN